MLRGQRIDKFGKTGDFSGRGFRMEDAFFGGCVNDRFGLVQVRNRLLSGLLTHREANLFDDVFYSGFYRFVAQTTYRILLRPL